MSGSNRRQRITLPRTPIPRLTPIPKSPSGWGQSTVRIRNRGLPRAARFKPQEPAGDPPVDWEGTRPEWAIYWALERLSISPEGGFIYQAQLPGVGTSYYSTVDFLVHDYNIGIEIQGTFWHYGLGSDKVYHDQMRATLFAQQGIDVIFIDETDALADPIYYTQEALNGVDHSELGRDY